MRVGSNMEISQYACDICEKEHREETLIIMGISKKGYSAYTYNHLCNACITAISKLITKLEKHE